MNDGSILFKEWLPDLPDLDNPGLTEAKNTLPLERVYKSFPTLTGTGTALGARPTGAYRPVSVLMADLYVGNSTQLSLYQGGSYTNKSASTYNSSADFWRFAEYDGLVIATNYLDPPQQHTVGAAGAFTALSAAAPLAQHVGIVGQFVVLGKTVETANGTVNHRIQWSGIDNPTSWPLPNSSTAIAQQSGEQFLNSELGEVTGIFGSDQWGVVLQQGGITRITYVGGGTVFQFDEYEVGRGSFFPNAAVQVGRLVYFISTSGFYVTDGSTVQPIGDGKVDRYFLNNANFGFKNVIYGAVDYENKLIYWSYPSVGGGQSQPDSLVIFNYEENRWTRADSTSRVIIGTPPSSSAFAVSAWQSGNTLGSYTGTPGTAILTTGEAQINPSGRGFVKGVKTLIDTDTYTVALGTRDDQKTTPSYTSEVTANARSGFADFRSDAKFHRARLTITGTFNAARGIEILADAAGNV